MLMNYSSNSKYKYKHQKLKMLRSTTVLGFFAMASLMMLLTSIASIVTMTIFSNVIALGKNSDK